MANPFPYFRWFVADAENDEDYAALTDQELGFFHRCLNRAWDNSGLPSDLDRLAATMRVTRKYLDKVWPNVGRCFELTDTVIPRYVNPRQEKEREYAVDKSKTASVAAGHARSQLPGFLYLIQRPSDGAVKIGSSLDVPRRLAQLRYRYGQDLQLVSKYKVQNMGIAELDLHEKHKAKRLDGEWFGLDGDEIDEFITVGGDSQGDKSYHPPYHPQPRAYGSGSGSDSSSGFEVKETSLREIPKPKNPALVPWPASFDFEGWFAERDRKHPIPGKPQIAKAYALERIFSDFKPAEFDQSHNAWVEYWSGRDGGIPTLAVFIYEAWYRKKPPARASPVVRQMSKTEAMLEEAARQLREEL